MIGHVTIPSPTQDIFTNWQIVWHKNLVFHLPIVGIMYLGPGVTELVCTKVLGEVLLDLVVAEGLHGIPGTRPISTSSDLRGVRDGDPPP